ncbi:transcription antitermination factor NusB [Deltaproteobacteria bacterium TL4]
MRRKSREYALQVLYQMEILNSCDPSDIDNAFEHLSIKEIEKPFTKQLILGTLAHQKEMEALLIQNTTGWKLHRLSVLTRNLLLMSIYEMCFGEGESHQVVMNEAMELAKNFLDESTHAFVNSVLQKVHDHFNSSQSLDFPEQLRENIEKQKQTQLKIARKRKAKGITAREIELQKAAKENIKIVPQPKRKIIRSNKP